MHKNKPKACKDEEGGKYSMIPSFIVNKVHNYFCQFELTLINSFLEGKKWITAKACQKYQFRNAFFSV